MVFYNGFNVNEPYFSGTQGDRLFHRGIRKTCTTSNMARSINAKLLNDYDQEPDWLLGDPQRRSVLVFCRRGLRHIAIARLYTRPEYRGQGLASHLMEKLVDACIDYDIQIRLQPMLFEFKSQKFERELLTGSYLSKTGWVNIPQEVDDRLVKFYKEFGFRGPNDDLFMIFGR